MTTIAYKDGVLAADSQSTFDDGLSLGRVIKIGKRGSVLFGASGSSSFCEEFLDWVSRGCKGDCPGHEEDKGKASGFIIRGQDILEFFPCGRKSRVKTNIYADGSGKQIAIGAMAFGATPEEAVKCASMFDIYTSGTVTVLKVGS